MKQIAGVFLACFMLTGCSTTTASVTTHMTKPTKHTTNETVSQPTANSAENTSTVPSTPTLPTPPKGLEWNFVNINNKTYEFLAKTNQGPSHNGLLASTKDGVAWTNPNNRKQILLSPSGTKILTLQDTQVIYTFTLPGNKNKSVYNGSVGNYDVSPDAPAYLFYTVHIFKKKYPKAGTWDIYALNLKTKRDELVARNMRRGGGNEFFVAYHSHYVIYNQVTPTISNYKSHIHVVNLLTGTNRNLQKGGYKGQNPKIKLHLDGTSYVPVWKEYGTKLRFKY